MERVFCHYKLKPGVTREQYLRFSRELDQVITAHRPGVLRFEVHMIEKEYVGEDGRDPSVEIVETIDVAGWEAWLAVMASDEMAPVRAGFAEVADGDSVVSWRGTPI